MIATRDNYFLYSSMPYVQSDVYGAYNASDNAFYFAWNVKEQASSDMLEVMFSDPSDTTIVDQILFDKDDPNLFAFYVFDTSIHARASYDYTDFIAEGGDFADTRTAGGMWKGEIKVPYSFIGPSFDFTGGDSATVHFNWATAGNTKHATTNPKKLFWPVSGGVFDDPGVGVSRP